MDYTFYTAFAEKISPRLYQNRILPYFKSEQFDKDKSFWFDCFGINVVRRYFVNERARAESFEKSSLADKSKYLVVGRRLNARKRLDIFFILSRLLFLFNVIYSCIWQ
ncbi:hypothetical protein [Pseudoalteromonas sp. BSi20652]|uniref:hypothetical protein n=1 Tax=Pseudoalteromonas sp. BSi20652 TaxID=388384 RepID=UPI000518AF6A|nr:hypothetical protein [Pseudoalteromonas sp. BSi20652]